MKSGVTDITLVVDRSGSMSRIRDDAQGGVNSFIERQAKESGQALLTLVQFDSEYEFLHKGVAISQVPKYTLIPRGTTALLDAVGRAINETGERLAKMKPEDRPGLVIFVIVTDGHENASKEFSNSDIQGLIKRQQEIYNWHFTFLAANQDAFAEARKMGMETSGVANFATEKVARAYSATSDKISRMRKQFDANETVCNEFSSDELEDMG
jgi:uncharacterized protein YegL